MGNNLYFKRASAVGFPIVNNFLFLKLSSPHCFMKLSTVEELEKKMTSKSGSELWSTGEFSYIIESITCAPVSAHLFANSSPALSDLNRNTLSSFESRDLAKFINSFALKLFFGSAST